MIPKKNTLKLLGQEVYTDGTFVYKFGNDYQRVPLDGEVRALEKILGIPNTQEIVEYDSKNNILVSKLVRGYHLDEKSDEFQSGIVHYSDEQLKQLFDTLTRMKLKGVVSEIQVKNLIYDRKKGFTPIDYNVPINPNIDFGAIYNVLSLQQIPIKTEFTLKIVSGKNQHKHSDILKRMIGAFQEVNFKEANIAITNYQNKEKTIQQIRESIPNTPSLLSYF